MKSKIRLLIRRILLEDAETEKLAKWADDPVDMALAKAGMTPVPRGEQGSLIGAGMSNEVREVVVDGKRAAARYSYEKGELDSFLQFMSYKDKLPAQYARHFPKVYRTFAVKVSQGSYDATAYGVAMELLDPLPPGLKKDLDSARLTDTVQRSRVDNLLRDKGLVKRIAKQAAEGDGQVATRLMDKFDQEVVPILRKSVGDSLDQLDSAIEDVLAGPDSEPEDWAFKNLIFTSLRDQLIPASRDKVDNRVPVAQSHVSKSVRAFYDFLRALAAAGLHWNDMHVDNFMLRRSTGDLVVVDPGWFDRVTV